MPSPFPGMDPYLEHPNIWEDFHANLAGEIQAQLTPQLRPNYIAALMPRVTYEEVMIEKPRLVKPDVSVYKVDDQPTRRARAAIAPAPLIEQVPVEAPIKLYTVEIREVETGLLVTAIEILSPVNKRPGHEAHKAYQRKRRDLLRTEVHLLELDLLRGGQRLSLIDSLPEAPYFIFLSRADSRTQLEIWPLHLQEPIPILPVPLLEPDPDVPLDLGRAIQVIYDRAAYDLRIDYHQPPPPPELAVEETVWLEKQLRTAGLR